MAENEAKEKEEKAAEDGQEGKKGGKSKKLLFIIIGAVVLLAGGAGAAFGLGLFSSDSSSATSAQGAVEASSVENSAKEVGQMVSIKPFVVNLADDDTDRYLKVTVEFEVKDEATVTACEANMAKMKDVLISLFSSKTFGQVRDIKGKIKLRQEVAIRANEILGSNSIKYVYFTEFIVQ